MKISEIASRCLRLQQSLGEPFTLPPLIRATLLEIPSDWRLLARSLYEIDMRERETLEPKIKKWLMDMTGFSSTAAERLAFRLRLDNAVNLLPVLAEDTRRACQAELDLPCSQPEEALYWALTVFWRMQSTDTLTSVAQAICRP